MNVTIAHSTDVARLLYLSSASSVAIRIYRNAKRRTVTVDKYDENRQNLYIRMATEEAEERYKRRAPSVEWAFANIKHVMGIRRFLLRGIKKVRTEWTWKCSAHNLSRIIN